MLGAGLSGASCANALRERGIFGGGALSERAALYCVTEVHGEDDIDRLVEALAEVTR